MAEHLRHRPFFEAHGLADDARFGRGLLSALTGEPEPEPEGAEAAAAPPPEGPPPPEPPRPLRPIETTKVGIIDTPYQRRNGYHVEVTVQHPDVSPTKHRLWVSHEARARAMLRSARAISQTACLLTPLPTPCR